MNLPKQGSELRIPFLFAHRYSKSCTTVRSSIVSDATEHLMLTCVPIPLYSSSSAFIRYFSEVGVTVYWVYCNNMLVGQQFYIDTSLHTQRNILAIYSHSAIKISSNSPLIEISSERRSDMKLSLWSTVSVSSEEFLSRNSMLSYAIWQPNRQSLPSTSSIKARQKCLLRPVKNPGYVIASSYKQLLKSQKRISIASWGRNSQCCEGTSFLLS